MDFVEELPKTQNENDAIWVIVDRLSKVTHFLAIKKSFSVERLAMILYRNCQIAWSTTVYCFRSRLQFYIPILEESASDLRYTVKIQYCISSSN